MAAAVPLLRLVAPVLLLTWAALLLGVLREPARSSDLLALWIAAQAFRAGELGALYPPAEALFTMVPPPDWAARATALGHDGVIFPYVYPPLWAAIVAPLTDAMTFQTFAGALRAINVALMAATGVLAWRIVGRGMPGAVFVAAGQCVMLATLFGTVALNENQPQILVTFLIALTIERLRADAPMAAGIALALAASLKLYPALFVILILAAGQYRAAAVFGAAGAALALASVALAGWPLHADFLATLGRISATAVSIGASFNLDRALIPLLAEAPPRLVLEYLSDGSSGTRGWQVAGKSAAWQALSQGVLVALLAALALWMHRASPARRFGAVWPVAVILVALVSPIAWVYYFCLPVMMAPALVPALGRNRAIIAGMVVLAPFSIVAFTTLPGLGLTAAQLTAWGLPAMVLLAVLFAVFGGTGPRVPDRPLRRAGHPL